MSYAPITPIRSSNPSALFASRYDGKHFDPPPPGIRTAPYACSNPIRPHVGTKSDIRATYPSSHVIHRLAPHPSTIPTPSIPFRTIDGYFLAARIHEGDVPLRTLQNNMRNGTTDEDYNYNPWTALITFLNFDLNQDIWSLLWKIIVTVVGLHMLWKIAFPVYDVLDIISKYLRYSTHECVTAASSKEAIRTRMVTEELTRVGALAFAFFMRWSLWKLWLFVLWGLRYQVPMSLVALTELVRRAWPRVAMFVVTPVYSVVPVCTILLQLAAVVFVPVVALVQDLIVTVQCYVRRGLGSKAFWLYVILIVLTVSWGIEGFWTFWDAEPTITSSGYGFSDTKAYFGKVSIH